MDTSEQHWSDKYIGREYAHGEYDCAHLASEVLQKEFCVDVKFPTAHAQSIRARDKQIDAFTSALAERTPLAGDGDLVLMRARGRARVVGHHIGVVCVIGNKKFILHNLAWIGVVRIPVDEILNRDLEIEGFYRVPAAQ